MYTCFKYLITILPCPWTLSMFPIRWVDSGLRWCWSQGPRAKSWETFATGSFWSVAKASPQNKTWYYVILLWLNVNRNWRFWLVDCKLCFSLLAWVCCSDPPMDVFVYFVLFCMHLCGFLLGDEIAWMTWMFPPFCCSGSPLPIPGACRVPQQLGFSAWRIDLEHALQGSITAKWFSKEANSKMIEDTDRIQLMWRLRHVHLRRNQLWCGIPHVLLESLFG